MNRKLGLYFAILLSVVLLGSVSIASLPNLSDKVRIVGYWFGVSQQEGIDGDIQEICHIAADGTFSIRFRVVQNGHPVASQNESGRWELKDNVEIMVTTQMDGKHLDEPEYITEKYLVTKLTDSEMCYVHMKTGTKFKLTRVKAGFEFP